MGKITRIISLGELVTPNFTVGIGAFAQLIAQKLSADPAEIGKKIGLIIQQNMQSINDFKLGKLNETDFTDQIINALETAIPNIKLSKEEFNQAWNTMNPRFTSFKPLLEELKTFNNPPNQEIILISFTNPKDIHHLINELENNKENYKVVNGKLIEIAGMRLHTTYAVKKTKAELIKDIIKELKTNNSTNTNLFNNNQNKNTDIDIKYVRGVNEIEYKTLKEDFNQITAKVEETAQTFFVDTLLWKKSAQSLTDILNPKQQMDSVRVNVSKL